MTAELSPITSPADPDAESIAPACVMSFNASDATGAGGLAGDVATIAAMEEARAAKEGRCRAPRAKAAGRTVAPRRDGPGSAVPPNLT